GVGINSLMARSLGAGNEKKARKAASTYLFCSIFHYLLFVILGLIIIHFFFNCFTKNEEII
ncbi:MAG: MATE family efflux transporter, partial [Acholeplasmatales bacterium]|nr:MATE family efflux transporter [Acholeplasmatales bacterium]